MIKNEKDIMIYDMIEKVGLKRKSMFDGQKFFNL